MGNYTMIGKIDGTDLRILDLLQENAERSIGEIAEAIHLSQNACWRRIRQLEEAGYIRKRWRCWTPSSWVRA